MAATNIATQKKKRSFGEWARSRDGQKTSTRLEGICYDCLFDCTSGITISIYISSVCRDGKLQLL